MRRDRADGCSHGGDSEHARWLYANCHRFPGFFDGHADANCCFKQRGTKTHRGVVCYAKASSSYRSPKNVRAGGPGTNCASLPESLRVWPCAVTRATGPGGPAGIVPHSTCGLFLRRGAGRPPSQGPQWQPLLAEVHLVGLAQGFHASSVLTSLFRGHTPSFVNCDEVPVDNEKESCSECVRKVESGRGSVDACDAWGWRARPCDRVRGSTWVATAAVSGSWPCLELGACWACSGVGAAALGWRTVESPEEELISRRKKALPQEVQVLSGGVAPSFGHGTRICKILHSEGLRQPDTHAFCRTQGDYLNKTLFEAVLNHKLLLVLLGPDKAVPVQASPREVRWALRLAVYSYQLVYRPERTWHLLMP
ncbi:uncharacterized protein LOC144165968 [Haemaphysalis longicornis]